MNEPVPFRKLGTLTFDEHSNVLYEMLKLDAWTLSNVDYLAQNREFIALSVSDKWRVGPNGRSDAGNDSGGSFYWRTYFNVPSIKRVAERIKGLLGAEHLGSVMLSKMEPGAVVTKHRDWSPYYEMHHRVQVCIKANPETLFTCDGEQMVMKPGDIVVFRNTGQHEVFNVGPKRRLALIVDVLSKDHHVL